MKESFETVEPTRAEIDAFEGPLLIEFGNAWCGHCRAAQPLIGAAMQSHAGVRHIKIADGPGLALGRSFSVKLWPTLIFLDGGKEKSRLVRPATTGEIVAALAQIDIADR
jgi:thioredoxin 1